MSINEIQHEAQRNAMSAEHGARTASMASAPALAFSL